MYMTEIKTKKVLVRNFMVTGRFHADLLRSGLGFFVEKKIRAVFGNSHFPLFLIYSNNNENGNFYAREEEKIGRG